MKFLKHVRLALVGDIDVTFYISIVNDPELGLVIGPLVGLKSWEFLGGVPSDHLRGDRCT
jgi:hypothetical protein